MTDRDLKMQLQCWATAYGGEQLARLGYAGPSRLTGNECASGNANADRIETIVHRMEAQGRWREARVLRTECFLGSLTEAERLRRLARVGLSMGRSSYYSYLKSALAFVDGAISES